MPLSAFSDNYLWLIHNGKHALIVDPGDAEVVQNALKTYNLELDGILLTHHHADHTGGAASLQAHWQCLVYTPDADHPVYAALNATPVRNGEAIQFKHFDSLTCQILALPGHTLDHIAYYINHHHLFSGDVLFGAGCGRLFEGTPKQMYVSLQTIASLPLDTLIYPAHEYTAHNIAFALTVEPMNPRLQQRDKESKALRADHCPTLPTTVALELETNPFLRCEVLATSPAFKERQAIDIFIELREQRNHF